MGKSKSNRKMKNLNPEHACPDTNDFRYPSGHKSRRDKLADLLIPFDPKRLKTKAPAALAILKSHPETLDARVIWGLVTERPWSAPEQGEDNQFAEGFGQVEGKPITSVWSQWVTFTGDASVWEGSEGEGTIGIGDGWTQYTTVDASHKRSQRRYSVRVAVVVTILRLVYQDVQDADAMSSMIQYLGDHFKESDAIQDFEIENMIMESAAGRTDKSSSLRAERNVAAIRADLDLFNRTFKASHEGRKHWLKLKSYFMDAGAEEAAEMLCLVCIREKDNGVDLSAGLTILKKLSLKLLDSDGDGHVSLDELITAFLKAGVAEVAELLAQLAIRNQLVGADLRGADLKGACLRFADMDGCDLTNASLINADLEDVEMMGALCPGVDFTGAQLDEVDCREGDLTNCCFFGANLSKGNFRDSKFTNSDLREVMGKEAIFTGADFENCKFEGIDRVTDLKGAFFDDGNFAGAIGLEEVQFDVLQPRKFKSFRGTHLGLLSLLKGMLPGLDTSELNVEDIAAAAEDEDEDDEDDEDYSGDEDDEMEDEEEEEEVVRAELPPFRLLPLRLLEFASDLLCRRLQGHEEEEQEAADDTFADAGTFDDHDEHQDDYGAQAQEDGESPRDDGKTDVQDEDDSDGIKTISAKWKVKVEKRAKARAKAKEDALLRYYAKAWDRRSSGPGHEPHEQIPMWISELDDGEEAALKPLKNKLATLKRGYQMVIKALAKDKSKTKDRRAKDTAEFLLDPARLEKMFAKVVATKDQGVQYARQCAVCFARTADEMDRSRRSILQGRDPPAMRLIDYKAHQRVLEDSDLVRICDKWCELTVDPGKGVLLRYRTSQKGAQDGERLSLTTWGSVTPNYLVPKRRSSGSGSSTSPRADKDFDGGLLFDNPANDAQSEASTPRMVSFTVVCHELEQDGDIDDETLKYTLAHDNDTVLRSWMRAIEGAFKELKESTEGKNKKKAQDISKSERRAAISVTARGVLKEGLLTLTIPNEDARRPWGWRSYLPSSCNCYDDENDQDEPDLSTTSGRIIRRFEKVQADLAMLRLRSKRQGLELLVDIADRSEELELFLAEQLLLSDTIYDGSAVKLMFRMHMKMMYKDLKELEHVQQALANLTGPIIAANWEDTLDTWLAVERLCAEVECQKAQRVLEMIFADELVLEALGMATQLREIRSMVKGTPGDALPEGLLKRLKNGLGSHIKRNSFTCAATPKPMAKRLVSL